MFLSDKEIVNIAFSGFRATVKYVSHLSEHPNNFIALCRSCLISKYELTIRASSLSFTFRFPSVVLSIAVSSVIFPYLCACFRKNGDANGFFPMDDVASQAMLLVVGSSLLFYIIMKIVKYKVFRNIFRRASDFVSGGGARKKSDHLYTSMIYGDYASTKLDKAFNLCFLGGVFFLFIYSYLGWAIFPVLVPFIMATFIKFRGILLLYRIDRGFFGRNAYEATQFLEFMLSQRNKVNLTGGQGGPKRGLLPASEREETFHVVGVPLVPGEV